MKLYLDTCTLHRLVDDRSQERIAREAEAVLAILVLCEEGAAGLVTSDPLVIEIGNNPNPQQRDEVFGYLDMATEYAMMDESVLQRAYELGTEGFSTFDALHLSAAEAVQADYLCTCDDRFLKRCGRRADLRVRVVSPLELAQEIVP